MSAYRPGYIGGVFRMGDIPTSKGVGLSLTRAPTGSTPERILHKGTGHFASVRKRIEIILISRTNNFYFR